MYQRKLKPKLDQVLKRGKSVLLLGPRQTGKTTLVSQYNADLEITLLFSKTRRQYESDPDLLIREVKALFESKKRIPLIIVDEIQKVPPLMDAVQYLIDQKMGQFILTGSSARKLKHGMNINLLPGRIIQLRLDPLCLEEIGEPYPSVMDFLIFGSLPAICLEPSVENREQELDSYVDLYLEEEVRQEALVREMGAFENFLKLASVESGHIVNFERISQDIGVARTTIVAYYQILEDCLIAEKIAPFTESNHRKKLIKSPRYLFFDLGLRRLAAKESISLPETYLGHLFEQFVGLELIRWARFQDRPVEIFFWKDPSGPEVDWLLRSGEHLLPIEVKWSQNPKPSHASHLKTFLKEYEKAKKGYLICRIENPQIMHDAIEACSWRVLHQKLNQWIEEIS